MGRLVDRHGPATMLSIIAFGLGAFAIFFSFALRSCSSSSLRRSVATSSALRAASSL